MAKLLSRRLKALRRLCLCPHADDCAANTQTHRHTRTRPSFTVSLNKEQRAFSQIDDILRQQTLVSIAHLHSLALYLPLAVLLPDRSIYFPRCFLCQACLAHYGQLQHTYGYSTHTFGLVSRRVWWLGRLARFRNCRISARFLDDIAWPTAA